MTKAYRKTKKARRGKAKRSKTVRSYSKKIGGIGDELYDEKGKNTQSGKIFNTNIPGKKTVYNPEALAMLNEIADAQRKALAKKKLEENPDFGISPSRFVKD